jgi:hypothetical protein
LPKGVLFEIMEARALHDGGVYELRDGQAAPFNAETAHVLPGSSGALSLPPRPLPAPSSNEVGRSTPIEVGLPHAPHAEEPRQSPWEQAVRQATSKRLSQIRLERAIREREEVERSVRQALILAAQEERASNQQRANELNLAADSLALRLVDLDHQIEEIRSQLEELPNER